MLFYFHTSNLSSNSWESSNSFRSLKSILSFEVIIKFHQPHKTHRSILKRSWKNLANTLRISREHLKNIKRTFIEYLEKIQKHDFEEDFNSQTEKWRSGGVGLSQTSPIPRSPDGDNNLNVLIQFINSYSEIFYHCWSVLQ